MTGSFIFGQNHFMERKKGDWTVKNTTQKFKSEFFTVNEDEVIKPDGSEGTYATVLLKPGVCVLPLDDEQNVYLTTQYRYAVEKESLEVPCGGLDEGENPLDGARREAKEELGIEAEEWTELARIETDTSIVNSPAYQFLARKLTFKEPDREGTENIKTLKMSLSKAAEKVLNGEITHALSCVLILKAYIFMQK